MVKNWAPWAVYGLLCGGCAGPPGHVSPPADTPLEHTSPAAASPEPAGAPSAQPAPKDGLPAPRDGFPSPERSTALAVLQLSASVDATSSALPPEDPARYARWSSAHTLRIGKGYLYFLEPFRDERWLLIKSADDDIVRIHDSATRAQLFSWSVKGLAADERHVVLPWDDVAAPGVLLGKRDGLWLHAAESGQVLAHLSPAPVEHARWSNDGRILMTVELQDPDQTARFRFFERRADERLSLVGELPPSGRVDGFALSPDNRFLARHHLPSENVTVTDLHTGEVLLDVPALQYTSSVEFSPDGRYLAMGGAGVKVVDLSEPARRAEYSHFGNNVAEIEFSPSGDVIAAPAYDGKVRLLTYSPQENRLRTIRTFEHQKNTNVYVARFLKGGRSLVTSSGDRTVRFWSGGSGNGADREPTPQSTRQWRDPFQWQEWGKTQPRFVSPSPSPAIDGHYVPARLGGEPAPSRVTPGHYACKITHMYRLRDCTVELDERGHTLLEFAKDNLLGLRGVLYDDGPVVRFEGWLTEGGNLGCATCAQQPIVGVLRGGGPRWEGLVLYKGHYDPLVPVELPPHDVRFEEANDRFPLVLLKRN